MVRGSLRKRPIYMRFFMYNVFECFRVINLFINSNLIDFFKEKPYGLSIIHKSHKILKALGNLLRLADSSIKSDK